MLQDADCNLSVDMGIHITMCWEGTNYNLQTVISLQTHYDEGKDYNM